MLVDATTSLLVGELIASALLGDCCEVGDCCVPLRLAAAAFGDINGLAARCHATVWVIDLGVVSPSDIELRRKGLLQMAMQVKTQQADAIRHTRPCA